MKPETDHPYPVGTRVMLVRSAWPQVPAGACGVIVGPYGLYSGRNAHGFLVRPWCYLVDFDIHPGDWGAAHADLIPLAPPDPIAEPREVAAPIRDEVTA